MGRGEVLAVVMANGATWWTGCAAAGKPEAPVQGPLDED